MVCPDEGQGAYQAAVKNNVLELAKICPETNKSKGDTRPRVAILKEAVLTKLN